MNHNKTTSASLPNRGLSRDLNRLKQEGGASIAEVRDFVREMKGKSPNEVLGHVAQSNLLHGVGVATIATVVLMLFFTLLPYSLGWGKKPAPVAPAPPVATAPTEPAKPTEATAAATPADPQTKAIDKEKAAAALGESESKTAAPDRNPLEDKGDDLLKDLK